MLTGTGTNRLKHETDDSRYWRRDELSAASNTRRQAGANTIVLLENRSMAPPDVDLRSEWNGR